MKPEFTEEEIQILKKLVSSILSIKGDGTGYPQREQEYKKDEKPISDIVNNICNK